MKRPAVVVFVIAALLVQGCTYVPGVEATDLSPVYRQTATRTEIEAVLGDPVASRTTDERIISLYQYDKGAPGGTEAPFGPTRGGSARASVGVLIAAGLVLAPFAWAATPSLHEDKRDKQRGFLGVVYAPNGPPLVFELRGKGEPEALLDEVQQNLHFEERAIAASNELSE